MQTNDHNSLVLNWHAIPEGLYSIRRDYYKMQTPGLYFLILNSNKSENNYLIEVMYYVG